MIEYVSANPTGPLHVGHGRGAAVGQALAKMLKAIGYEVVSEYYINDAGRQMKLLGASVHARVQELAGRSVTFPEDGYHGDYIGMIAKDIHAAKGTQLAELLPNAGRKEIAVIWPMTAYLKLSGTILQH